METTKISRTKKYPECEKLDEVANVQSTLMQFTEWLQEQGYEISHFERFSYPNPSNLVYQFMGVDSKKLDKERRAMLAKLNAK